MRTPAVQALVHWFRRAAIMKHRGLGLDELLSDEKRQLMRRRSFLAATTALGLGACAPRETEPAVTPVSKHPASKASLDVAVIGGGTAGLHAALRLAQAGLNVRL